MFGRLERMLDTSQELGPILSDAGNKDDEGAARTIAERMGRARMEYMPNCTGVINGVIFRDSRLGIMIQLADIVAYAVHRHCRKSAYFHGWFESIKTKFGVNPTAIAQEAGDGDA